MSMFRREPATRQAFFQECVMLSAATFDFAPTPIRFPLLDELMVLSCRDCGEEAEKSLACAAQEGWEDFDEVASGMVSAVCPDCALCNGWQTGAPLDAERSAVDAGRPVFS
jgi:hypothetical protein